MMEDCLHVRFFWVSRSLLVDSPILFISRANLAVLGGAQKFLSEVVVLLVVGMFSFSFSRCLLKKDVWMDGWLAALRPALSTDPCRLKIAAGLLRSPHVLPLL
jgi:hypothetical protein